MYVTVRLVEICRICLWVMTKMALVLGVLVVVSPCMRFLNSFPKARAHVFVVIGLLTRVLYFVIDLPVTRCITGVQKCSQSHVIACDVGNGAYV